MPHPTFTSTAPADLPAEDRLRWKLAELEMVRHGLLVGLHMATGDKPAARLASEAMTTAAEEVRYHKLRYAERKGHCHFDAAGRIDGEART